MKIAISGLNNTDNPAPGIGVAKSLKEEYDLIGLSYDPNEPGVYQGLFEKVYLMPYPSLGYEEFKNRIKYIKEQSNIDAIIPNLDAELPLYIKYQEEINKLGLKTFLPTLGQFEMRDKSKLEKFSKQLGVKHPKTLKVVSLDDLVAAANQIGFPLMIKGNYYKAYKAYNMDEAIKYYYKISNEWGFPLLVQEVINGVEINYIGVSDYELKAGVAIKKLTTTDLGKVWSAVSIKNSQFLDLAVEFGKIWRGAFELEAMVYNNEIYLIEINPRFPAWVYFATAIGVNLPKKLVQLMNGENVKQDLEYPVEKMYVRYVEETTVDFKEFTTLMNKKEI
jgi:carbamoyl-phosphate synthase large subunit